MLAFLQACAGPRRVLVGLFAGVLCVAVSASFGSQVARSGIVAVEGVKGVHATSAVSPQARALLTAFEKRGAAKAFDQLYVGQVSGQPRLFVALGRKGNTAIAYVCDGTRVGMWFTGSSAAGKKLALLAADGSTLRGSIAVATPRFVLTRDGYPVAATLRPATVRDLFIRFRIAPPYESVGGIIGIRGVLRGLANSSPPTGDASAPPPATSTSLSGPGVTLTSTSPTSFSEKDQCAFLAAQYEANKSALESDLTVQQLASSASATQLAKLKVDRSALVQQKLRNGVLTKTEAARLAQLEVEIDALQRKMNDLSTTVERLKAALDSLAKSYQMQRLKLGCP